MKIAHQNKDQTAELQEAINVSDAVILEAGKEYKADGFPENDNRLKDYKIDMLYGVLNIRDKDNFTLKSDKEGEFAEIYCEDYSYAENDNPKLSYLKKSIAKISRGKNHHYENLLFRYAMTFSDEYNELRPRFEHKWEFGHGLDIQGLRNSVFKNIRVEHPFGDGIYLRYDQIRTNTQNTNIQILDYGVHWNGRQGIAIAEAHGFLIDNFAIEMSARGGIDLEPPVDRYVIENGIIRKGHIATGLLSIPMGGKGTVRRILIEDITYSSGRPFTQLKGNDGYRGEMIFRRLTALNEFGSPTDGIFKFNTVFNIVIEDSNFKLKSHRSQRIMNVWADCENIVIRNNDFDNGKYIHLGHIVEPYHEEYHIGEDYIEIEVDADVAPPVDVEKQYDIDANYEDEIAEKTNFGKKAEEITEYEKWIRGEKLTKSKTKTVKKKFYRKQGVTLEKAREQIKAYGNKQDLEFEIDYYDVFTRKYVHRETFPVEEYDVETLGEPYIPVIKNIVRADEVVVEPEPVPEEPEKEDPVIVVPEEPEPTPEEPPEPETPPIYTKKPIHKKPWFIPAVAVLGVVILIIIVEFIL